MDMIQTNDGQVLFAKYQQGKGLQFTHIALGDGVLGGSSMVDRPGLISQKMMIPIDAVQSVNNGTNSAIIATVSNEDLAAGFYYRELAVLAKDPDTQQVKVCLYGNSSPDSEYIPDKDSGTRIFERFRIITVLEHTDRITIAGGGNPLYLTAEDIDDTQASHTTLWSSSKINSELEHKEPLLSNSASKASITESDAVVVVDGEDGSKTKRVLWGNLARLLLGDIDCGGFTEDTAVARHNFMPYAHENLVVDGNDGGGIRAAQALEEHAVDPGAHPNMMLDGNIN